MLQIFRNQKYVLFSNFAYLCRQNFLYRTAIRFSMNQLPQDPMLLYSVVNMMLRDRYNSLDELCDDLNVNRAQLEKTLAEVGFEYSACNNKFW